MNRKQARHALDHHGARVGERLADERHARFRRIFALHDGAHPLSPCPRLAGAAAAKHQPDGPWRAAAGVLWR
jgi:hypothetical protein